MDKSDRLRHWVPARTFQDHPGAVVVAAFVALLGGPVAFFAVRDDATAIGIWIGAMLGLAFAIIVEPLNRLLWRDHDL